MDLAHLFTKRALSDLFFMCVCVVGIPSGVYYFAFKGCYEGHFLRKVYDEKLGVTRYGYDAMLFGAICVLIGIVCVGGGAIAFVVFYRDLIELLT